MVTSTLGFIYSGNDSKKYNGHDFKKTDQGWITFVEKTNSYQTFVYLPNEVENLGSVGIDNDFIYIVDDGYSGYGSKLKNIFSSAGIVSQIASFDDNSSLSVVNCTNEFPIIVLNETALANTEVYKSNNCIFINGNLNKGVDFLAYVVFGIIK